MKEEFSESFTVDAPPQYTPKEFLSELNRELIRRDTFTADGIRHILDKISCNSYGSMLLCNSILKDVPFLTLEEKKTLKINTRLKISKSYFDSLSDKGKASHHPNDELINALYQTHFKLCNKYQLSKLERLGVKRVGIMACGDQRDCKHALIIDGKTFSLEKVPNLPLPNCDAPYCRCTYIVADDDDDDPPPKKKKPARPRVNKSGCAVLLFCLIILNVIIIYFA